LGTSKKKQEELMTILMKSKINQGLTGRQIEHLIYGWCLGNVMPFESDSHRKAAWFENREYILSLQGIARIPGVFGYMPLRPGEKPQAMKDYEKTSKMKGK